MKKIFLFAGLVLFLSTGMVSCGGKDAKKKPDTLQTLEKRYPGWANLTWISTDDIPRGYPRMEISIRGNVVTMKQFTSESEFVSRQYTMMYLLGNTLTLEDHNNGRLTGFYWQTDSTILLKTKGLVDEYLENPHTYELRKN
jgi:hypothetical protein